jgi:hypothetical protein
MFGMENLPEIEIQESPNVSIGYFVLSLLQLSAQSKIIHWQTRYDREHRHYGDFYNGFNDLMDTLVESIAGKCGKDELKFGEAALDVCDYEMAVGEFFDMVELSLKKIFASMFDREQDSELFNIVDEIMDLVNKTKYLLQFEP